LNKTDYQHYQIVFGLIKTATRSSGYLTLGELELINTDMKNTTDIYEAMSVLSKYGLEIISDPIHIKNETRYEVGWGGTGRQTKDKATLRCINNHYLLDIPRPEKDKKRQMAAQKHTKHRGPFTPEPKEDE
jgi:hypothetical protein